MIVYLINIFVLSMQWPFSAFHNYVPIASENKNSNLAMKLMQVSVYSEGLLWGSVKRTYGCTLEGFSINTD